MTENYKLCRQRGRAIAKTTKPWERHFTALSPAWWS